MAFHDIWIVTRPMEKERQIHGLNNIPGKSVPWTHHWAVLVNNVCYELLAPVDQPPYFRVGSWDKRKELHRFSPGKTNWSEQEIKSLGDDIRFGNTEWDFLFFNCQTFAVKLVKEICDGEALFNEPTAEESLKMIKQEDGSTWDALNREWWAERRKRYITGI